MLPDDITQAVLARKDVARYLRGGHGQSELQARERIHGYLDELRTTQRYPIYRALKHPLYPILRKVERVDEHVAIPQQATRAGRVIYVSNHKSHLDYLVEPLVLDDNGIRPPVTAAGINLFGGPLGLLHRHVTGAIPIRRNTKDPAYLVTLKAYVAELLQRSDLLFYIEGGRSYTGEMKTAEDRAAARDAAGATSTDAVIVPVAVAYDLVLEDHILPHAGGQAAGAAVRPRGGRDGPLRGRLPVARVRDVRQADSARRLRPRVAARGDGPRAPDPRHDRRALQGAADGDRRGGDAPVDDPARARSARRRADRTARGWRSANLGVQTGREAVEAGAAMLAERNIIHVERGGRYRVRERTVLRYYARTIQHLLAPPRPQRTH